VNKALAGGCFALSDATRFRLSSSIGTPSESGAGPLHLAVKSEKLMSRNPVGEAETMRAT